MTKGQRQVTLEAVPEGLILSPSHQESQSKRQHRHCWVGRRCAHHIVPLLSCIYAGDGTSDLPPSLAAILKRNPRILARVTAAGIVGWLARANQPPASRPTAYGCRGANPAKATSINRTRGSRPRRPLVFEIYSPFIVVPLALRLFVFQFFTPYKKKAGLFFFIQSLFDLSIVSTNALPIVLS